MAQNTGSPNFLPWPDYTDDADGPDAFENLARATDLSLKGLQNQLTALNTAAATRTLTVSDWIRLGSTAVNKDTPLDINRLAGGTATIFRRYINSGGSGVLQLYRGATVANQLHMVADGDIARIVANGSQVKYFPFAVFTFAVQTPAITAGAGRTATTRVNFPGGRFTQVPAVVLTPWNVDCLVSVLDRTTTWLDIRTTAHMDKGIPATWVHGIVMQARANDAFY
jgi:hypothetical protein